jgi:hypothetical protein
MKTSAYSKERTEQNRQAEMDPFSVGVTTCDINRSCNNLLAQAASYEPTQQSHLQQDRNISTYHEQGDEEADTGTNDH